MCIFISQVFGNCRTKIKIVKILFFYGVINVIGELPVFMTPHMESTLLGPNPTGVIGLMFLIVLAIALYVMLKSKSVDKQ